MSQIITFDVGGQKYKVSKSQIDLHPNSMLARCVSEQWRHDLDQEIFIDRDGPLFRYVLTYMRNNGKVNLPFTVSKDDLVDELVYFGFQDIDLEKIHEGRDHIVHAMREAILKESMEADYATFAALLMDHFHDGQISDTSRVRRDHNEYSLLIGNRGTDIEIFLCRKMKAYFRTSSTKAMQSLNQHLNKAGYNMTSEPELYDGGIMEVCIKKTD